MARRRRGLTEEDRALWKRVAASVTPQTSQSSGKRAEPDPAPADPPVPSAVHDMPPVPKPVIRPKPSAFRIGEKAQPRTPGHELAPTAGAELRAQPVRMDRKAHKRMTRGKLEPEARIDLHGMTLAEAHPELLDFIARAYGRGMRLVLVITGKGREREEPGPIPVPRGILKTQVPRWLQSGPLRLMVLQVTEAHQSHGGTGAYYVYLRRHR